MTESTITPDVTNTTSDITSFGGRVDAIRDAMQQLHDSCMNHTYEWRIDQLKRMDTMLREKWYDFASALSSDLGSCTVEVGLLQVEMIRLDLHTTLRSHFLKDYTQPKRVPSPLLCFPAHTQLMPMPLNGPAVLIIGPSNYPLSMIMQPLIGALGAGNPVVIKPSEYCPATANILEKHIHTYFEANAVQVVQGEAKEAVELLKRPWGKVFFTGSPLVGRAVATAAAQTLTPTTLELGGKCPCIVDPETCDGLDLTLIANRIVWAKFMNCGQSCASVDTLFVSEQMLSQLLPKLLESLHKQYGAALDTKLTSTKSPSTSNLVPFLDSKQSKMGRIVTKRNAQRLYDALKQVEEALVNTTLVNEKNESSPSHSCRVVVGGTKYCDIDQKFIPPTIIINPPSDCKLMNEEVFGPILPIVTFNKRSDILQYIRHSMHATTTPLCLYVFTTSDTVYKQYVRSIRAGSVMRNDCMVHLSSPHVPFGGLGTSGHGAYHGKHSLECFTQWLPSMHRNLIPGADFHMARYPPFHSGSWKEWLLLNVAAKLPDMPVLYLPEIRKMVLIICGIVIVMVAIMIGIAGHGNFGTVVSLILFHEQRHQLQ